MTLEVQIRPPLDKAAIREPPLKTEMVHCARFSTRHEARAALFEYIEIFYNRKRRHSSIGYRTPAQARMDMATNIAA